MRLHGRRAIITGGLRGIGREIAEEFLRQGASVAIIDKASQPEAANALASDRTHEDGQFSYQQADISEDDQVTRAVERAIEQLGGLDILVNVAGICTESDVVNLDTEDWDRVMAVNLRGVFLCSKAVLPNFIEQGSGRIINIASQLGQIGGAGMAHYSASKAGVIGFTKALAREVAGRGILVNAIAPGPIMTDMLAADSLEWKQRKMAELPLGRFGTVDEVAPTAVFLASEDGRYYTGQTLGPNGGDVML